jgi:hypothetical protein
MPRKKVFQNRAFIGFIIEGTYASLLESIAHREQVSKSELCRRVILEWLENEARVKYGMEILFELPKAAEMPQLLPLVAKRYDRILEAWHEVAKPIVELVKLITSQPEVFKRVLYGYPKTRGYVLTPEERAAMENHEKLRKLRELRRRFFKECYYPYLAIKKELPLELRLRLESNITRTLELLDKVNRALGVTNEYWREGP